MITIFISIISLSHSETLCSDHQPLISFDRIIQNEKKIETLLKNRSYYRNVFTTAKIMGSTVGVIQAAVSTYNTMTNAAAWILGHNQRAAIGERAVGITESNKEWVLNGMLSAAGTLGLYLGGLGLYYLFAKTEQQYGPAPDIRWFVAIKNPFYITLRELYFLAQEASITKDSQQLITEMKNRLDKLVDQTEQVVAFMRYKKEKLSEKRKSDADYAINHLLERIQPLYDDIAQAIATDAYGVTYHLDSVLRILEGDCARFAQAEGSRWINPSVVLDMMQNFS